MNTELNGLISPEEIAELKKKFLEGLYSVEVNGHIAYFKHPNRHVINFAMSQISKDSQPLDYFEHIAKETKVAGSDAILEDDQMFMELVEQLKEIITYKNAKLVKL